MLTAVATGTLLFACSDAVAPTRADGVRSGSFIPLNLATGPADAFSSNVSAASGVIHVDAAAAPGGDGSGRAPFRELADAVTQANAQGGGTIVMAAGVYMVNRSIQVGSSVSIRGANDMASDASGLPTGALAVGRETRIVGASSLGGLPVLAVGGPRVMTHGVTIADLTLQPTGALGIGIEIIKTQDFTVRGNVLTGAGFAGVSTIASSGRVIGNFITLNGCGACVAAGNTSSPASVEFKGNRSVRNMAAGLLLNGSGTTLTEIADVLDVSVRDNDIGDNSSSSGFGYGIRVFVVRRDGPDAQATGHVRATLTNNRVRNNRIGLVVDAGFPYRTFRGTPDPRPFTGSVDLSLRENVMTGNAMRALVTFTRSTAALDPALLNPSTGSSWKYLQNSIYRIVDPDGTLAGYRKDHPIFDPVDHRELSNALWYNGRRVATGRSIP